MLDLLMSRRSIRKYQDKKVEKEKIDTIIKGALTSPTGHNRRPWEIIVVEDKKLLKGLAESKGRHSEFIEDAAVGFVILADSSLSHTWMQDTSIMATIIQLLGQSLGLGSCWIDTANATADDGSDMETNVKEVLDIPMDDNIRIQCMISMGYPAEERKLHNEEAFHYHKVHYNKY